MMIRHTAAFIAALLAAGPALGQDMAAGQKIAETWCSTCHAITATPQTRSSDGVAGFAAIAAMPSTTEMSLAAFLNTPHGRMPNFMLSRAEIADVSAYIIGLRGKR